VVLVIAIAFAPRRKLKKGPGVQAPTTANLLGEVYSPEGGLVLGSKKYSMSADADFQCQSEK
jgi:hypothetical protein